ncbi:hypothetical protein CKM354_000623900 [Cercospora kikuchii]|uniref:Fumarylacetoacetase-like C-terminal domain-containing protein n=1 Tax=Cercospora kikuchii TaxID=84275 RepID=A0A9P3FD77_9PEZI|nr:uncharacterized protein CKM354_000623900 [Cercospora kikuchii]GIZ42993.1 hypothetical protein CKM354_000623900 [Cercospora kikuchii]
MPSLVNWKRLIRYKSTDGQVKYGEPILPTGSSDVLQLARDGSLKVKICTGDTALSASVTSETEKVAEVLCPLSVQEVPFIRCVGLNYRTHILETGRSLPENPSIFCKPSTTLAGPSEDIPIPPRGQAQCDYEGELTILIGRDAKNVPEADALSYVAGYLSSNDVSARDWQREPAKAGPVPQWSYSKSYDKYAPMGPCIVSTEVLGAADNLKLETRVNGEVRQSSNTGDLVFGVKALVSFLSQGQTIQAGSLIMTGTPGGVGLFQKPPNFLKDGDVVEVEISGIGKVENRMTFE